MTTTPTDVPSAATFTPTTVVGGPATPVSAGPFQCTLDDYREATVNVRGGPWRAAVIPLLLIAYIVGLWLWMAQSTVGSDEARAGRAAAGAADSFGHLLAKVAATTAPVLLGVPLLFLLAFRYAAGRVAQPWDARYDPRRRRVFVRVARFVLFTIAATVLLTFWNLSGLADWYERFLILTLATYVLVLQLVFNVLLRTAGISRRWAAHPWLHRPATLEAADGGFTLAWPDVREQCRWAMVRGYKETPNLLLLYPSPYEFRMIPKRAFASPADLERFKGLLSTHVRNGFFLPAQEPGGFPLPPAPAPLRVEPIGEPDRRSYPPPLPTRVGPQPDSAPRHDGPTA